jgi:RNA polymerase sigma-70 factor (ECF subfamily)
VSLFTGSVTIALFSGNERAMAAESDSQILTEELVVLALLGNLDAFDALVRRFRSGVTLVAESILGSRCAAEDVAQETFLLAFKALPQLQHPAKFPGWLHAIARHRARRVALQEGRSRPAEPSELDALLLTHSRELTVHPAEALERRDAQEGLRRAVAQLPAPFQTVLRLYYFEEWSVAQIAAFLSLTANTVKWRLHQGRHLLRAHLTRAKEHPHERIQSSKRDQTDDAPAGEHEAARQRGQHDRQSERQRKSRRAAVQRDSGATGAARRDSGQSVPPAEQ